MEKKILGKKNSTGNYLHQEVRQTSVAKILAAVLPYTHDIHREGKKWKYLLTIFIGKGKNKNPANKMIFASIFKKNDKHYIIILNGQTTNSKLSI